MNTNKGKRLPAEVLSPEEIVRFFDSFGTSMRGRRNRLMFILAYRCQLRSFEVTALRVGDVDTKKGTITVLKGKGNKRRVVGVDLDTCRELDAWIAVRPHNVYGLLFASSRGQMIDTSYMRKVAAHQAVVSGIHKRVHVHAFRHTGACYLADSGVDVRVIQGQLGHSSLAVTDRYLNHLSGGARIEALRGVSWQTGAQCQSQSDS